MATRLRLRTLIVAIAAVIGCGGPGGIQGASSTSSSAAEAESSLEDSQSSAWLDLLPYSEVGGLHRAPILVAPLFFAVKLPGNSVSHRVAARLYRPAGAISHSVIQLLLHGATYDGHYWEIPDINGNSYSYGKAMAERGYVVISVDQLGAGDSDKPDGDAFGLEQAASVLDQVARQLRRRLPASNPLVYVGHSNGSVTAIYSQGTYGAADGLVTTGWDHGFRPLPVDPSNPALQQALASSYVSIPGPFRSALFYDPSNVDPAVVDYDNAHLANAIPRKQFLDLLSVHADITGRGPGGETTLTRSQQVRVPVLVQAGEEDFAIAPASVLNAPPTEAAFYPLAPSFEQQALPNMGHAFTAHLTHQESEDGIDQWLQRHYH